MNLYRHGLHCWLACPLSAAHVVSTRSGAGRCRDRPTAGSCSAPLPHLARPEAALGRTEVRSLRDPSNAAPALAAVFPLHASTALPTYRQGGERLRAEPGAGEVLTGIAWGTKSVKETETGDIAMYKEQGVIRASPLFKGFYGRSGV